MLGFPDHFVWILVVSQRHKTGMSQMTVRRPVTKLDLRDQLGLDPCAVFHFLPCQRPLDALAFR
jgi:hypothetical protein